MRKLGFFFILSYILFCFIACKDNVKKMIDNGDFKYWKLDSRNYRYYYYFGSDGKWNIFEIIDSFQKYKGGGDILLTKYWYLKNDSVINVDGGDHKIVKLTHNKLVWENVHDSDSFTAATQKEIPRRFWKRQ